MATLRYQKRFNKWYVYEVTYYWDKNLKKSRQRTKYLGVATENNGNYKKLSIKETAIAVENEIVDYGDSYAINEISKTIGLSAIIKDSFDDLDSIMALICFQITEGSAMHNCIDWLNGNIAKIIFPNAKISSQNISNLFKILGKQDLQVNFFKSYVAEFFPENCGVLIDSTSLPSAINDTINAFGYTAGGIEQNITCLMLVDKHTHLPIYFRAIGGDIADISTIKTTVAEIKKLGLKTDSAILDAGFCSKENLQFMCEEKINFITRLPRSHKIFYELIKQTKYMMESSKNAITYADRVVFVKSKQVNLYGHNMYAHVFLDPSKKAKDTNLLLKNKLDDTLSAQDAQELDSKIKSAGYFILLSFNDIEKSNILPSYYARQFIEQIFGFIKSNNNLLPLRVHSEQSIKGYLMLSFLALIIFIVMRQRVKMPMDKTLITLRSLKAKIFDNKIIVQELNKKNKDIMKSLKIMLPIVSGV
jgi:transposase